MRTKLIALTITCLALVAGASAQAAPIPVASYTFMTADDVNAFQSVEGTSCTKKQAGQMMSIAVGRNTNSCVFRTSVIADSSTAYADQGLVATVSMGKSKDPKLASKGYVAVGVRQSSTAGYQLRLLPGKGSWQYLRDPKGPDPAKIEASGQGKFIKAGTKPNTIMIRAFAFGGTDTSVVATVNGNQVVSTSDPGPDQPDGRNTTVGVGAKGTGAGTGITGLFDTVTVQVPNPG
jgi:hypothetical protein